MQDNEFGTGPLIIWAGALDLNGHNDSTAGFPQRNSGTIINSMLNPAATFTVGNYNSAGYTTSQFGSNPGNANYNLVLSCGTATAYIGNEVYALGTTVTSGTLQLSSAAGIFAMPLTLGVSGGTAAVSLSNNNANGYNCTAAIQVPAGQSGTVSLNGALGVQEFSGAFTLNGPLSLYALTPTGGSAGMVIAGNVSGSGGLTIAGTSATVGGVVQLAGKNAFYTGSVQISSSSTLQMGSTAALNAQNAVALSSSATLDLNAVRNSKGGNTGVYSATVAGLNSVAGNGMVTNSSAGTAGTLTLGGGGNYNFSGSITAATCWHSP